MSLVVIEVITYLSLSIIAFGVCFAIQQKYPITWLNPLLMTVVIVVLILLSLDVSYAEYMEGAQYINYLLEPAVVVLGYPLYKQMPLLRSQWRKILLICLVASFSALSLIALLGKVLGLENWLIASMVTMNITTAVSMSTAIELGGNASIAAVMVLIGGLTGSVFGVYWLSFIGLIERKRHSTDMVDLEQQKRVGLAIGSASHALGTASIAKQFPIGAAYSSTALILCAFASALLAPIYIPLILAWM